MTFSPYRDPMPECYACHEELPVEEFAPDSSKASGHSSICKPCDREKSRRYYQEHREEKIEKVKARYEARKPQRHVAVCETCGGSFERARKDRVYCSRRCKDRARWAKWIREESSARAGAAPASARNVAHDAA
jgi:uncharacterized CHY-type Zn-finger protein